MATLSPLDKLMPRGYVRQMFCFPSTHAADTINTLRMGLKGVVNDVPYLLSGVLISEDGKHIYLSSPYQTLEDLYYEQDLSDTLDYAVIEAQNFPPSAFTAPGIIPPHTQPPFPNPAPVFRASVSLVKGGFILCVAVHHCTTDITGFGALLKIWASRCRTGASVVAGFDQSWLDRGALIERHSTLDVTAPPSMPRLLHVRGPDDYARLAGPTSFSSNDLRTGIYFFSQTKLQAFKHVVNEHIASQGNAGWVSSGDILTALLWSAILVAESNTTTAQEGTNTIGFPVNFRSRLSPPLPSDYLGAAFVMAAATASRTDLISLGTGAASSGDHVLLDSTSISKLAQIASTIRASLRSVDEQSVRDTLTYLYAASSNHPPITLGPRHDGISIVSWADQGVYELDWGDTVGRCGAVRLPKLANKRYPIVLPRIPSSSNGDEGGLEVIVSFDRQVLFKFEQSWPIKQFATPRCRS
ncbi:transferase family-domain-containing protein [Daldinia vernicosa]|uniref:transferase family-domain-containing protein n=1 Tax=Daldinia vernicosa TaxID=114800 RepID=UPI002007BEC7|nr:transferase family-domain-containing protein [Daldinia vernicosa]KAI0852772.1 transferase family-domain-containing protein [Daldinia vernicosa]